MGGGGGAGDLNGGCTDTSPESGGGVGGGIIFFNSAAVAGTARLNASGGAGVDGSCDGGGGGGVVVSNVALGSAVVLAGAAGIDLSGGVWNGLPGLAGQSLATAATTLPGLSPGYLCLPQISVTKTALTPTVTAVTNATAQWRITVANAATAGAARNLEILDATLPTNWTYQATNAVAYTPAPPAGAGNFAAGADTAANVAGYSVGTAIASSPAAASNSPAWSTFFVPPGGQIDVTFTAAVPDSASVGTYHNPAGVRFRDPTTTTVQKITPAVNNAANRSVSAYSTAAGCTTAGTCVYASGATVAGSNFSGLEAGPTSDDVVLPVDWSISKNPERLSHCRRQRQLRAGSTQQRPRNCCTSVCN